MPLRLRTSLPAILWLAFFATQVPAEDAAKPIRVGIVGLDSYHAFAFTQLFHELKEPLKPRTEGDLGGLQVVAAFPGGSSDIPESVEGVPQQIERLKRYELEIVDSIEALLPKVDAVIITSLDGRAHRAQAMAVIDAGKPVFIDRPMAASLEDAIAIFEHARAKNVPIFSCSQHRFSPGFIGMRNHPEVGKVLGAAVYGGFPTEPHHPDLVWHAVHSIETLYTIMGPGCVEVTRTSTDTTELVVGRWKDGRIGTYRGIHPGTGAVKYSALVFGSDGIAPAGVYGYAAPVKGVVPPGGRYMGYESLAVEIAKFFKTGKPPVTAEETIEIFAFMAAAQRSKEDGGSPVALKSVLPQRQKPLNRKR